MALGGARLGFQIEEVTISATSLPRQGPPLRFAHLSDIHMRALRPRHQRLVDIIRERQLDFVFLTGDAVSRSPATWEGLAKLAGGLNCRHGIFACRGNWEVRRGPRESVLKELMAGWGVRLLINESRTVQTASGKVCIGGVDDLGAGWPDFESAVPEASDADYTILLSHGPLASRLMDEGAGVDLILSGHTHGGQIRIPLLWRWALPSCDRGVPAGLYRTGSGYLYVSRGFGTVGVLPIRFRCPPEVTFFEVRPG